MSYTCFHSNPLQLINPDASSAADVAIPTVVISEKAQPALAPPNSVISAVPSRSATPRPESQSFESLQLLISLDVALELIQSDREALKRVETFALYPGRVGGRVKETIEEVFILLLQALSNRHIAPGFRIATEQMRTYKPAEHEEATSVAPLLQFFELVHIGDTIQSMVQVYFDKEMVRDALQDRRFVAEDRCYRDRPRTSTGPTFSTASFVRRSDLRTS